MTMVGALAYNFCDNVTYDQRQPPRMISSEGVGFGFGSLFFYRGYVCCLRKHHTEANGNDYKASENFDGNLKHVAHPFIISFLRVQGDHDLLLK